MGLGFGVSGFRLRVSGFRLRVLGIGFRVWNFGYHIWGSMFGVSDNAVVDAFKLILLIYNNFSIVKKVVNKIVRVK